MEFSENNNRDNSILLNNINFIENQGQKEENILFYSEYTNNSNYFLKDKILFGYENKTNDTNIIEKNVIEMAFNNAHENIRTVALQNTLGTINYFKGHNPNNWNTGIQIYKKLVYINVWDKINLKIKRADMKLKFDWILKPKADIQNIKIKYTNVDNIFIDDDGNLVIKSGQNELIENSPVAYQDTNNKKVFIDCKFKIYEENDEYLVGFEIGDYNNNVELVIDPILTYSTFLGGTTFDYAHGITTDSYGYAYVTGSANSSDFPTTPGAFQTTKSGSSDTFVTKFSQDGNTLIYSTYIGGTGSDIPYSIKVDKIGNVYINGATNSSDFPVTPGAFQTTYGGGVLDVFVTKLSPDGNNLVYSTYIGGSNIDNPRGLVINDNGNVYITGYTDSTNYPTTPGSYQPIFAAISDSSFITELSQDGSSLVFSTFLSGPASSSRGIGIDIDATGLVYISGETQGISDFPITPDAYQTTNNAVTSTCYIAILSAEGTDLLYATYFGGSIQDIPSDIKVSQNGSIFFSGSTLSSDFPVTVGTFQDIYPGSESGFITKLTSNGSILIYSSYLGGANGNSIIESIAIDEQGRVYSCGNTQSSDFPTTQQVRPSSYSGNQDGFVSIFNSNGSQLLVSYYLGGSNTDVAYSIALDNKGRYICCRTNKFFKLPCICKCFSNNTC